MSAKILGLLATILVAVQPVWRAPLSSQNRETAFGFQVGEERRYVLGPPEALWNGESATWAISLGHPSGAWSEAHAVFKLRHERSVAVSANAASGEVLNAEVEGELTVNADGFPMLLRFTVRQQAYAAGVEEFTVRYTFEDGHYLKQVWAAGTEWTITIPIAGHKNLDESVPAGLYLFSVSAIHCLTPSYVEPRSDVFFVDGSERCDNNDPALLNPGLLSLALPVLWEASGAERDYLFFTPTGPDLYPGLAGGTGFGLAPPRPGPGVSGSVGSARKTGDIDTARDRSRYYEPARVRLVERAEVALNRRRLDAWQLRMEGPLREVFVDDEGKVLRVDLPPHPVSGGSRWIRLLLPTEY